MAELFNPTNWFNTYKNDTTKSIPIGDLFEHHVGYPNTQIFLDTTAPNGDIIINENASNGGEIKIHQFVVTAGGVSSTYLLQDAVDNYLSEAIQLVSAPNEDIYERIGYNDVRSIVASFPSTGVTVSSVSICATALRSKQYVLEAMTNIDNQWKPYLYMIANQQTTDVFTYTFSDNLTNVIAVRIKYKGDYYASSGNQAALTLSAYDDYSGISKMRVSHYPNFSDAPTFAKIVEPENSDVDGWFNFTDGISLYDWTLVNDAALWQKKTSATDPLKYILNLGNNLLTFSSYSCYLYGTTGAQMTISNDTISAVGIYNSKVYVGTTNGKLYSTIDGKAYISIDASVIGGKPITALTSFQNKLYIGTNQSSSTVKSAIMYTYDENTITSAKIFTQPIISCMTTAKGSLYVGLTDNLTNNNAAIYRYNNKIWQLSTNINANGIDTLTYSVINDSLWAGLTAGTIRTATFDVSNNPQWTAIQFYANDSTHFYNITSDPTLDLPTTNDPPTNNYVWICSDTGVVVYVDSMRLKDKTKSVTSAVDTNVYHDIYFETIANPADSPTIIVKGIAYLGSNVYCIASDGNIYQLDLSVIGTKTRAIYVQVQDNAGNITNTPNTTPYIYDETIVDFESDSDGNRISSGLIYQITSDKEIIADFQSPITGALTAPNRQLESVGTYISDPLYIANLTQWDKLTFLYVFPATSDQDNGDTRGLDYGMSIDVYIRAADTESALLAKGWGLPYTKSVINKTGGDSGTGTTGVVGEFSIDTIQGRYIQYYIVMTTASRSKSPVIKNVTLTYKANGASYFFTSMFDAEKQIGGYYNSIRNGDFETDTTTWTTNKNIVISTTLSNPISGNKSGKISWDGTHTSDSDQIYCTFDIDSSYAGKTFELSFDYLASDDYIDGTLGVSIFKGATISLASTDIPKLISDGNNVISHFSQTFTVPADTTSLTLQLVMKKDCSAFDFIIDNIYIGPAYVEIANPPKFRRGILTANTSIAKGAVYYGYTTNDNSDITFDFSKYTAITPNTLFELAVPASKIRFGMLLVTIGQDNPTIVQDFAIQLDAENSDIRFHEIPNI